MATQLNETLDNGAIRTTSTNAPYAESDQNRTELLGPFSQHAVAASQAGVALPAGIGTGALTFIPAPKAGKIIGISWGLSTAATHTAGSVKATVGGTAEGDAVNIDGGGTDAETAETTPQTFNAGDKLGVKITTDANWTPTPDLAVYLVVQYNP